MLPEPTDDMSTDDMIRAIYTAVNTFLEKAYPVIEQLGPTIDALANSPIGRMLKIGRE